MSKPTNSPTIDLNKVNSEGGMNRAASVTEVIDAGNRTVELAFSSEVEVRRWYGTEVLDHTPGAMRTERIGDGAPLLVNHDHTDQIGVVETVSVDQDNRGRATVRFGSSPRADEIWRDVQDGIRRHVSVGYRVHSMKLAETRDGEDIWLVDDWEPTEISIVSVPADHTVGVGRSAENPPAEEPPKDTDTQPGQSDPSVTRDIEMPDTAVDTTPAAAAADDARSAVEAERDRVREINNLAELFGGQDFARQYLDDGSTPEVFQRALLEKATERGISPLADQSPDDRVGLSDKEADSYSFLRAMRALVYPKDRKLQEEAAFEFEVSRAAGDKAHKTPQGVMVPPDVLERSLNTGTSGTNPGDTGGHTIANNLLSQSFVEMLRNRTALLRRGSRMGGLIGTYDVPRQISGITGYWIGEDDPAPEGAVDFGLIKMAPKTVAALAQLTRSMLMQSSLDVEAITRRDLATAIGHAIDYAGLYGSGSSNQPLGIFNQTGINALVLAGDSPTYAETVAMETAIAADNADVPSMAYFFHTRERGALKTTQKFAGTNGAAVWEPGNTVNGYNTEVTNQITPGDVLFGNYSDALVGFWGGLDLVPDPYTHSDRGRLRITVMQDCDIALRRADSFCMARKA